MKYIMIILVIVAARFTSNGQSSLPMRIDTTSQSVAYWTKWTDDLYDRGVDSKKDSFFVKQEVIKLLKDSVYRQQVYPARYDWIGAIDMLNKMELKKAFWYMINLYQTDTQHRELIMGTFALYDSLMEMDKILVSTFYTYAFPDPRVCRVVNGKPEIYRPDILEKGLRTTKEIAGYLWAYREQKAAMKKIKQ